MHGVRFALLATLLACSAACAGADEAVQIQESAPNLRYDKFVEGKLKRDVIGIVRAHIAKNRKAHGNLVYTGNPSGRKRQFSVVRIFEVVSSSGGTHTVQVDVDEIGGKERLLLFFDVIERQGRLELNAVRLGPQHRRQTGPR